MLSSVWNQSGRVWDWKLSLFDLEYLYLIVDHILAAFFACACVPQVKLDE